jgi:hypothetical protein
MSYGVAEIFPKRQSGRMQKASVPMNREDNIVAQWPVYVGTPMGLAHQWS